MRKIYLSSAGSKIARHHTIRDINKQIVLNYVRARSPISRAEIARETSLQRSTISSIVEQLQADGFIDEIGTGDSTGGRKPTLLRLRKGTPAAIGVDVTPRETRVVLADLTGQIMEVEKFPTSSDIDFMNENILEKVSSLANAHQNTDLQVGISIPGIADQESGRMIYIPYFRWSDWDIGQRIISETGLPVIVDNDANAVALAELWFGADEVRRTQNFIVVMVAEGIGTGIIIDGQIYRGDSGAAGEFGHMFVGDNAPVTCSCGRRDCWEAHASEKAMIQRYGTSNGSASVDINQIISLAQNGEKQALGVIKDTARSLGMGISNLIIGFSPQKIIIAGNIVRAWELISEEIHELAQRSVRHEVADTTIVPSELGANPTTIGSISLVLSRKFAAAS